MSKSITATISAKVKVSSDKPDEYPNGYIDVVPTDGFRNANGDQFDTASLRWPLAEGGYTTSAELGSKELDIPAFKDHSRTVDDMIGGVRQATWDDETKSPVLRIGLTSLERGQEIRTLAQEGFISHNVSLTYSTDEDDFTYKDGVIYDANIDEVSIVWKGANRDARVLTVASKNDNEDKEDKKMPKPTKEAAKLTLDEAEIKAIADQVKAAMSDEDKDAPNTPDESKQDEDKEADKTAGKEDKMIKTDKSAGEAIAAAKTAASEQKAPESVNVSKAGDKMDKVELTAAQFVAYVNRDTEKLAQLNKVALATYGDRKMAAIVQTSTPASGGVLVPSAELLADVYSSLGTYSAVAADLRVITLEQGDSLDVADLVKDVVVSEVAAEGGSKSVTAPEFGTTKLTVREFAGIAIVTKKLVRQAAINVYDLLRDSFARAIARKRAEMALTDAKSGIIKNTGVVKVQRAGVAITYADIKHLPYKVAGTAASGGKYYLSREALEAIDTEVDKDGRPLDSIKSMDDQLSGTFKNGYRFVVEDALSGTDAEVIFGNMSRYGILLRQAGVEDQTFDTGEVKDGATTHNLLQENKLAERVAFYETVGFPVPSAFAISVKKG